MRKALACSLALLAFACAVALAATPVTGEITVNTGLPGDQEQPVVAMDADGDFAVVWEDRAPADQKIRLRRFTSAGAPSTGEITMDTTAGDAQDPSVAMSATGAGVAVWQNNTGAIVARRFDAVGAVGAEIPVDAGIPIGSPDVAMDADGDFVVVWENGTAAPAIIRARRFDETGAPQGGAFTINETHTTDSLDPAVAIDSAGNFVVAWERFVAGGNDDVFARAFNAAGSPQTNDIPVATGAADQDDPESAMDADGDFAVGWESGNDVQARRYNSAGTATTAAFPVHAASADQQGNVRVGLDASGASLSVAWDSDASGNEDVVTRRFGATGTPLSGEVTVNTTLAGSQQDPGLGADSSGRFVVAWESNPDTQTNVIARRFDPGGTQPPPPPSGGRPDCQDPARILVTCRNPTGAFTIPGVCGPSFGTILPACNIPSNPTTVCGPSFGTILTACQLPQSKIIACGSFGTILPQCNNPPTSVPQVCGGSGTSLPKCTGANQLVLACGPSTGTPLPPCNFPTKINATPLETGKSATVTLTTGCAPSGATTTRVNREAVTAQQGSDTCEISVNVDELREALWEALAGHAFGVAEDFRRKAEINNQFIELNTGDPALKAATQRVNLDRAAVDRRVFGLRVSRLLITYFGENRPKDAISRDEVYRLLTDPSLSPRYASPEGGAIIGASIDIWALAFDTALKRLRRVENGAGSKKSSVHIAQIQRPKRVRVLSKRYKVRTGRKRGSKRRGKTRKIKIKLSKRTVNRLVREAARSKRSKRVIPLRLVVSYRGKLNGRRIPVARLVDVQLRVKPKRKRKKR